jgi:uncharacterized membrane protein
LVNVIYNQQTAPAPVTGFFMTISPKNVYITQEMFDQDLEYCLIIIGYPDKLRSYYVVEYTSPALYKSIVHIYIKN